MKNSKFDQIIADSLEVIGTVSGNAWDAFITFLQGPKTSESETLSDAIRETARFSPF